MKTLVFAFIIASGLIAQTTGSNVVTTVLVSGVTTPSNVTYLSPVLQNVGQSNHRIVVGVTAQTATLFVQAQMLGSTDCINYFPIGVLTTKTIFSPLSVFALGTDSFPCLKASVLITNSGTFTYNVTYVGNSVPPAVLVDSLGSRASMIPLPSTSNGLVNGDVGTQLVVPFSASSGSLSVYFMAIDTNASASTFQLFCTKTVSVITPAVPYLQLLYLGNLNIVQHRDFPISERALFTCPAGVGLGYSFAGASSTGNLNLVYRIENN